MAQVRIVPKRLPGANPLPQRMRFGKTDRIILSDRIDWRCKESDEFGHVLQAAHDKNIKRSLTHAEMRAEAAKVTYQHDREWYSTKAAKLRLRTEVSSMMELPYLERQLIMWKVSLIEEVELLKLTEPEQVSHGDKKLPDAIARAQKEIIEHSSAVADKGKRKYFGRLKVFPHEAPCIKSYLRWHKIYTDSDRDPLSLRSGKYKSGRRDERMSGEQLDLIEVFSRRWLARNKPKANGLYDLMKAHIEEVLNPKRAKKKLPPIKVPSKGRFFKAIDEFDEFERIAGREGIDEARRQMHAYGEGIQDVERALQEVEIDHWTVGLRTILTKARIWHRLNRKTRRRLEKVRMILGAAICRRTRVVVGMTLSRTPSVDAAIRLIEMVVSDKRRFAEAAGCITPYDIAGVPELILFDGGPAFNNSEIASVLRDLNIDWGIAPSGLPHLRGMVERLFGMIDDQAISWFEGRTFADVRTKGDYDPDARTDTSVEEMGRALVRYVVDRHHNKPRLHLGGEAPRECYMRLSKRDPVWGPPDATKMRNVFGIDVKRVLRPDGIRFLGIQYRSALLHKHFLKHGGVQMTCRVHLPNLGAISVRIGKKLFAVPGPEEFDGVDAETWIAAEAKIRAKMKHTERTISGPIINAALLDVARQGDEARKRAHIDDSPMPRKVLNYHEARMRVFANFPEDRLPEPASNQDLYADALKVGAGAGDPSDPDGHGVLPEAKPRAVPGGKTRGGRCKQPAAKPAKAAAKNGKKPSRNTVPKNARKTAAKPGAAPPRSRGPSRLQRRPGLKRTFSAKD